MSDTTWWWLALGIFALVTVVVATLLGVIIATARRIEQNAAGIWTVGKQIAGNTASLWMLQRTKESLGSIDRHVRDLDRRLRSEAGDVGKAGEGSASARG